MRVSRSGRRRRVANGRLAEFLRFANNHHDNLLGVNLKLLRGFGNNFQLIFLIANLGTLVAIWIGGHRAIGGTLSHGQRQPAA
jgi:hypothetical protein